MPVSTRESLTRFGAVALAACISFAASLLLSPVIGVESIHPLNLAAVIFSAWYGGVWLGVATTCLVATLGFLLPASFWLNLTTGTPSRNLHSFLFLLEGASTSAIVGALRATRRRAASDSEQALRQSEERFRIVARATNDAVWDWNLQTNKVWWNDSVTTLFGYSREEVSCDAAANGGATWWYQHIHAEDRDRVVASIYATITSREQEWSAEYRFGRPDGSHSDVHDRAFVVYDEQNNPVRMIGSMMDITERKRAERERATLLKLEREARSEAEGANRVKDEFLAMVSHELRTPLTTIKMMARLMQREAVSEAERHECLESISNACDRETDLVLNLLDVSSAEAGALYLNPTPVDVAEILDACVKIEAHAAAARGHELRIELPPAPLLPISADRKALRRVLCNLIENAIKYTPDGGRITLSARADADQEIAISVSDTGRGIAPEDLPRLFEKFYRGRAGARPARRNVARGDGTAVEPETPGVGLGLYLSQTIVERLGGRLGVESEIGAGSTFIVHLPAWPGDETYSKLDKGKDHEEAFIGG